MIKPKVGEEGVYDIGIFNPIASSLPRDEGADFVFYINNLINLNSLLNDFINAVSLFKLIEIQEYNFIKEISKLNTISKNKIYGSINGWKNIAARDAGMTVFGIREIISYLQSYLKNVPYLNSVAKTEKLDRALVEFDNKFKNAKLLRNAIGHRCEITFSPKEILRHTVDNRIIIPHVDKRVYRLTFKKMNLSLEISIDNHINLAEIINLVYSSYPNIVHLLPPISVPKRD